MAPACQMAWAGDFSVVVKETLINSTFASDQRERGPVPDRGACIRKDESWRMRQRVMAEIAALPLVNRGPPSTINGPHVLFRFMLIYFDFHKSAHICFLVGWYAYHEQVLICLFVGILHLLSPKNVAGFSENTSYLTCLGLI